MSALLTAARAVEDEAARTRSQIEAERSDGFNKLTLLAEYTTLVKIARALRAASAIEARSDATGTGAAEGESAVGKAETP